MNEKLIERVKAIRKEEPYFFPDTLDEILHWLIVGSKPAPASQPQVRIATCTLKEFDELYGVSQPAQPVCANCGERWIEHTGNQCRNGVTTWVESAASQPAQEPVSMAGEPFGDPHPCDVPAQEPVGRVVNVHYSGVSAHPIYTLVVEWARELPIGTELYAAPPSDTARQDRIMELADEYNRCKGYGDRFEREARAALETEVRKSC